MLRPITITPVLNGFIVQVGCQSLAYTDINKLTGDLGDYLKNPEETEKKLIENEGINRRHTLIPVPDTVNNGAADPSPVGFAQDRVTSQANTGRRL